MQYPFRQNSKIEYQVPFIAYKLKNHRLKQCKILPSGRLALVLGLILLQKLVSASFQSQLVFTKTKLLLLRLRNLPTTIQAS